MTADDYVRIIVALFADAEHDHARHDMLVTLIEQTDYRGRPFRRVESDGWEAAVREVLGA